MIWEFAQSSLAQWAGAAATSLAVVVALFKDPLIAWFREPVLKLTCNKAIPCTVRTSITTWPGRKVEGGARIADCYFIRIQVTNIGRSRAEKVQVSAFRLAKRGLDGRFVDVETTLPSSMRWANLTEVGTAVAVLDGISRNMSAFCDIVSLRDPSAHQNRPTGIAENVTVGLLELEFYPREEWHLLAPGTYRLSLTIGGANVEPIERVVEFTHTGTWVADDEAMRRDNLDVSLK
jgi:hypothetical protein